MALARTAPARRTRAGAPPTEARLRWAVTHLLGRLSLPRRVWLLAAVLIAPALLVRLFTSIYPFLSTVWLSLTDDSAYTAEPAFIGLGNYADLLGDSTVRGALLFTIVFAGVSTVLELVLGFALALLLNATFRLRGAARAVALIPWAIPAVVSALGFRFIFSEGFGIVPHLLGFVGVDIDWLTNPVAAKIAVILANVWRSVPFVAFVILAGLQGVPGELYQAAKVDGAGWLRTLWSVVVPLVTPLLITMGVFMVIFQLGTFDTVLGMTGGGPGSATQVAPYLAYQEAFIGLQYGRASAIAMLLFLIVLAVGVLALRSFRRSEVEL
ncbi:carbohydrate ABC transporter permease [Plantactinospora sp. GCM10030261]|uniref:carbohydrate ABC transporter permease n=1 Tax=Plantactinospora sp. GCM10030261 TaxID=3273420 RepID=UPI00360AB214